MIVTKKKQKSPFDKYMEIAQSRKYFPVIVRTPQQFLRMVQHFERTKTWAMDTETVSVEDKTIVGFSIANSRVGYYIPLGHNTDEKNISLKLFVKHMKPLLEDPESVQVLHNAKFDLAVMAKLGIYPAGTQYDLTEGAGELHDTMIMSWLMNVGKKTKTGAPFSNGLKDRCDEDCGIEMTPLNKILDKVKKRGRMRKRPTVDLVPIKELGYYAALDAVATWMLFLNYREQIEKTPKIALHYHENETRFLRVLNGMELAGYQIDAKYLVDSGKQLEFMAEKTKKEIFRLVGFEFDLNSTKDLQRVLFREIGLPSIKETKTGAASVDAKTLEALAEKFSADKHMKKYGQSVKALPLIIKYRNYLKMKSTYCDGILSKLDKHGRVHCDFKRTGTETGRLSSSSPNLQNLPREDSTPVSIREAFIAKPGCKLLVLDYSQLELRILAHFTNSKNMLEAYRLGRDLHSHTASKIGNIDYDEFEKIRKDKEHPKHDEYGALRTASKSITFGIIYGMGVRKLAASLNISEEEAEDFQRKFFKQYPEIEPLIADVHRYCRDRGYVVTLAKRRRYIPDIWHHDKWLMFKAQREAFNLIIQGTGADVMNMAMIDIAYDILPKYRAYLINQVHDEIHIECPEEFAEECFAEVKAAMESPTGIKLRCPLVAEGNIADTWKAAK